MASNTRNIPEWLTKEKIAKYKSYLKDCPNPYTQKEVENIPLDAPRDTKRYLAYSAKKILSEYGLI